jgi:hypothetical protein
MSLYLSKLESKLDKALSKETRESLTEWIGFKRNKPQTTRTMKAIDKEGVEWLVEMDVLQPNLVTRTMKEFKQYRRKSISEMRPYVEGEILDGKVSISQADKDNGSPKVGDMIARNPKNHEDQWLVAKQYFEDNLEEI